MTRDTAQDYGEPVISGYRRRVSARVTSRSGRLEAEKYRRPTKTTDLDGPRGKRRTLTQRGFRRGFGGASWDDLSRRVSKDGVLCLQRASMLD